MGVRKKIFDVPIAKNCPMGFLRRPSWIWVHIHKKIITFELYITETCVTPLFHTFCTWQDDWKHHFKDWTKHYWHNGRKMEKIQKICHFRSKIPSLSFIIFGKFDQTFVMICISILHAIPMQNVSFVNNHIHHKRCQDGYMGPKVQRVPSSLLQWWMLSENGQ